MGVGQPLCMKLKNVHLPHPHPNGGFSVGEGLILHLCFAAMVEVLSEITSSAGATAGAVSFGSWIILMSWLTISVENKAHVLSHTSALLVRVNVTLVTPGFH